MQHKQETEHKAPDAPGVYFTGETKSGFARWAVQASYNDEVNQDSLIAFCQWRQFGKAANTLRVLLQLYLESRIDATTDPDEDDEMAIFFKFLSNLTKLDADRTEKQLDDLQEDYA